MSRLNTHARTQFARTHEGAPAQTFGPEALLRRSVMNCMLWENSFYEDGQSIADRIMALVPQVDPQTTATIAIEAREKANLRHVPLLIVRAMVASAGHRPFVANTLARIIRRPDELTEFLAMYWSDALGLHQQRKKRPLPAQVKKGLAKAFTRFDAYQLAKYDREGPVRLRDVLFLTHAKPADAAQAEVWKQLIDGKLATPDTWETQLSSGADKKETFARLITERKLGALALLRNLRNMCEAGIERPTIAQALNDMNAERVLPYRFIAAARHVPDLEPELESAMMRRLAGHRSLSGTTRLLIDVSGSMEHRLSSKSDLTRLDAACGLAILAREICEHVEIFTFSNEVKKVLPRRGFALRDAIVNSQPHQGTLLGRAVRDVDLEEARLIVLTDEQSADQVLAPKGRGYMINVASYRNGVGNGDWLRIDGFSESVIDWIIAMESRD